MKDQFPDGDSMEQAMLDAGISSGYQEKPCIDPNDEDCPDTAPNKQSKQVQDKCACSFVGTVVVSVYTNFI